MFRIFLFLSLSLWFQLFVTNINLYATEKFWKNMVNIPFTANTHLEQNESYDYYSQLKQISVS